MEKSLCKIFNIEGIGIFLKKEPQPILFLNIILFPIRNWILNRNSLLLYPGNNWIFDGGEVLDLKNKFLILRFLCRVFLIEFPFQKPVFQSTPHTHTLTKGVTSFLVNT